MASFSLSWYFLELCCNLLMMTYTSRASTAKIATAPKTNPILNDSNRVHISCSEFRISNFNLESVYQLRVSEERRNRYRISNPNLESFDHQIHQVRRRSVIREILLQSGIQESDAAAEASYFTFSFRVGGERHNDGLITRRILPPYYMRT